jgi:hypothetical protein
MGVAVGMGIGVVVGVGLGVEVGVFVGGRGVLVAWTIRVASGMGVGKVASSNASSGSCFSKVCSQA